MKNAMIVTKNYRYYPMSRYEANWWLVQHNVSEFHCNTVNGVTYFYIGA